MSSDSTISTRITRTCHGWSVRSGEVWRSGKVRSRKVWESRLYSVSAWPSRSDPVVSHFHKCAVEDEAICTAIEQALHEHRGMTDLEICVECLFFYRPLSRNSIDFFWRLHSIVRLSRGTSSPLKEKEYDIAACPLFVVVREVMQKVWDPVLLSYSAMFHLWWPWIIIVLE